MYSKDKGRVSRDIQGRGRVSNTVAAKSETASMTKARIDSLIEDSGAGNRTDYAQAWITSINPTDFLNMTLSEKGQNREYFDKMPGDYGSTVDEYDYIEGLKKETRQTPFLAIDYESGDVVGHEGRHRMRALEKEGITNVEICVQFRDSDGRLIKTLNGYGKPLTTIDSLEIFNQRGTGQASTIFNIIPLNSAHSEEIFASYGQDDAKIVFSEETDENTKAVRNERTLRKQVERLKALVKLQGNITHGSIFTDASVGKQATELRAKYNIKQNANSKVKEALHKFLY